MIKGWTGWALCVGAVVLALEGVWAPPATGQQGPVSIVVASSASDLERFAAAELQRYVKTLFGLDVSIQNEAGPTGTTFRVGVTKDGLGQQGILLRPEGNTLTVAGGSPRAVLWAVYELAQRWGVRYLLHGDVIPDIKPIRLLPESEIRQEPSLPVRAWRCINDFACGPESWGMADYRPVIDQLTKLKFSRILLSVYPWQPFLHVEAKGVSRQAAWLWYDYHYPITEDMPGRALFGDAKEFWNPDLPLGADYATFEKAGEQLVHSLMAYAHARGMECAITVTLTEFPKEFASVLPNAQPVHQLANLTVVPSEDTAIEDPVLHDLAAAVLQSARKTYPEADYVCVGMPEWRQWTNRYEEAWSALNAKYKINVVASLQSVLEKAQQRTSYPGGAERAVAEVKGDLATLYFYDRLFSDPAVWPEGAPKIILTSVAEELFPILPRILPKGAETINFIDYTAARVARRLDALRSLPANLIPSSLIFTLHDDNVGVLPQLATGSLHELTTVMRASHWAGFQTRYWMIGDHDPCVAYLSAAAWNAEATPEAVYRDQIRAVCGDAALDDMLAALREVEAVTVALGDHALGLTFPVPGMIMNQWTGSPMPPELVADREAYRRALDAARRAFERATPAGKSYAAYWVGRLEFAVGYLDTIEAVRVAATAETKGDWPAALAGSQIALAKARAMLESFAHVARDQSDRGAIAVMADYVYRPLAAKVTEFRQKAEETGRGAEPAGWREHLVKQGDGSGGWICKPAEYRFLHQASGKYVFPFGVVQMANGEVVLAASWNNGTKEVPVLAFSSDRGDTWSDWRLVPDVPEGGGVADNRPMMLAWLGVTELTFVGNQTRYYSQDGGRTWPERVPVPPAPNGKPWAMEGNALVEREATGKVTRMAEIGCTPGDEPWPRGPFNAYLRWSSDGGRTWGEATLPPAWKYEVEYRGKKCLRGCSEGSLVRAQNGWLVAALRTDMPPRYLDASNDDSLEGTGVSLSRDDGRTWSPVQVLYDAGRHHAHLLRLPNGDLVMTLIVRDDVRDGRLASYRRGCDAIVSHDNGLTWDLAHQYVLDDPTFLDPAKWYNGECGHLSSTLLDDGRILTVYGNYLTKGTSLIRWKP